MHYLKKVIVCVVFVLNTILTAWAQTKDTSAQNEEIPLSKDSVRKFFGIYEFNPEFRMRIYSESANRIFAQRIGDAQKFEIFPKKPNVFFLKAMPAELEFERSKDGSYQTLILHQGGKEMKAGRKSYQPYELYDTIMQLDSAFYRAYNNRDLKTLMSYLSENLEFYHDLTGLTDYRTNFKIFRNKFADTSLIMKRVLVPETAEVFPIKNFGAVETGTHRFYVVDNAKGDRLAAEPRFVHIWKKTGSRWKIVRVISYDH